MVVTFRLPECTFTLKGAIAFPSCVAFQRFHDYIKRGFLLTNRRPSGSRDFAQVSLVKKRREDRVHVIRHDAVGVEAVDFAITLMQGIRHDLCNRILPSTRLVRIQPYARCPQTSQTSFAETPVAGFRAIASPVNHRLT